MTARRQRDIELRLGRWQEALADVDRVDAVITDPPYSERTHRGHRLGTTGSENLIRVDRRNGARYAAGKVRRRQINYDDWADEDVEAFVRSWSDRVGGWLVALTSHDLYALWRGELEVHGRYVFHPIPCVMPGMTVRLSGDGPSSWCVWGVVSRPACRRYASWGTLPGAYVGSKSPTERAGGVVGGKPLWLMRALVRDYTRPGELVCDPLSGWGTTARACQLEGRRFIGAEMDPNTYRLAVERLQGWGPSEQKGQRNLFVPATDQQEQ